MDILDTEIDWKEPDGLTMWAAAAVWEYSSQGSKETKDGSIVPVGKPVPGSTRNAVKALGMAGLQKTVWLNKWTGNIMEDKDQIDDVAAIRLKMVIEGMFGNSQGYHPGKIAIENAIEYIAQGMGRNPRLEQITEGDWEHHFNYYPGFARAMRQDPDDQAALEICKLLVRGVVVRAVLPGSTFPYCPILYSPHQGAGKGDTLKILSGGYHSLLFTGMFALPNSQQLLTERFRGKSVVEIGEFDGVSGHAADALKSIVTDGIFAGVRAAYGRQAKDWPMTAILVGTTNSDSVLTDNDNRRYPVLTIENGEEIDLHWIADNVESLWAQAFGELQDILEMADPTAATYGDIQNPESGIVFNDTGGLRVQIPTSFRAAIEARAKEHRQISPHEEWLSEKLSNCPNARVYGQPLFMQFVAAFPRAPSREFADGMKALEWQKRKVKISNRLVTVWETANATGDPWLPPLPFIQ